MEKTLVGYIVKLEGVVNDLNEMIADLEGNTVLERERDGLADARDHVKAVAYSFRRLKGIK